MLLSELVRLGAKNIEFINAFTPLRLEIDLAETERAMHDFHGADVFYLLVSNERFRNELQSYATAHHQLPLFDFMVSGSITPPRVCIPQLRFWSHCPDLKSETMLRRFVAPYPLQILGMIMKPEDRALLGHLRYDAFYGQLLLPENLRRALHIDIYHDVLPATWYVVNFTRLQDSEQLLAINDSQWFQLFRRHHKASQVKFAILLVSQLQARKTLPMEMLQSALAILKRGNLLASLGSLAPA